MITLVIGPAMVRAEDSDATSPVVVELFTSQGCYSCPPAEAYLHELAARSDIIALEYHVDYWDYIGWKDPFASPAYTQRQRDYVRRIGGRYVYTPQMVIGGRSDEIGSRRAAVAARIDAVAMEQKVDGNSPVVTLKQNDGALSVQVTGTQNSKGTYDIVLVGFDKKHETDVPRGENAGKRLINANTVRSLSRIAQWSGEHVDVSVSANQLAGDGGCAVLIQEPDTGRIIAAQKITF